MPFNKKPPALVSRRLAYGLDTLSKAALVDLVVDLARREIGEDATDDALATTIEQMHGPIARARGDKPPKILDAMRRVDRNDAAYRLAHPEHQPNQEPHA